MEILKALFILGIPVGLLTWILTRRLYQKGLITTGDTFKETRRNVGKVKSNWKGYVKEGSFLEKRWMKFGGGFYGMSALITFFAIEAGEAWQFITQFPGFSSMFSGGPVSFIVNFFVNQIQNMISAFVWFAYWPESENILVWVLIPYICYLVGLKAASRSGSEVRDLLTGSKSDEEQRDD